MEHSRAHAFATQRRALVHAKHITRGTFENPIADAQSELALQDGNQFVVEHSPSNRTIVILRDARTSPRPSAQHRFKPGTRLIREWQGKVHEVTIGNDGRFVHQGVCHASLSSVARTIIGTRWSGPAFFGLQANDRAKADGTA